MRPEIRGFSLVLGGNGAGRVGDGTTTDVRTPVQVLAGATQVSAGYQHTCAVMVNGTAQCWGSNASGRLGTGDTTNRLTPTAVSGLPGAIAQIHAQDSHSCARTLSGQALCWGANGARQLGDGTTTGRLLPTLVSGMNSGVLKVEGGPRSSHTCTITAGGAYCWGPNTWGQLGNGTTNQTAVPIKTLL